jgi:hypothetical protein
MLGTSTTTTTTTTESIATTIPSVDTSTTSVSGHMIDFGPKSGDVLAVVGVSHDDILNLRDKPGPSHNVVATIDPTYMNLVAQGEAWDTLEAIWIKVDYEGTLGWVHLGFVAYLGYTDDVTSTVVTQLGEYPEADTMEGLGLVVAEVFKSTEPLSRIVMSEEPTLDDPGKATYDVIGLGDDAEHGVRLRVFGEPTVSGFVLSAVELTSLCARGVTADDLCI